MAKHQALPSKRRGALSYLRYSSLGFLPYQRYDQTASCHLRCLGLPSPRPSLLDASVLGDTHSSHLWISWLPHGQGHLSGSLQVDELGLQHLAMEGIFFPLHIFFNCSLLDLFRSWAGQAFRNRILEIGSGRGPVRALLDIRKCLLKTALS